MSLAFLCLAAVSLDSAGNASLSNSPPLLGVEKETKLSHLFKVIAALGSCAIGLCFITIFVAGVGAIAGAVLGFVLGFPAGLLCHMLTGQAWSVSFLTHFCTAWGAICGAVGMLICFGGRCFGHHHHHKG